jgi:hypothetical protein
MTQDPPAPGDPERTRATEVDGSAQPVDRPTELTGGPEIPTHRTGSDTDDPTASADRPAANTDGPTAAADPSAPNTDGPTASADRPATHPHEAAAFLDRTAAYTDGPTASVDRHTTNTGEPAASADRPATHSHETAAFPDRTAAYTDGPTASVDRPAAYADEPTASADRPAAYTDGPTGSVDRPTAYDEGPTVATTGPAIATWSLEDLLQEMPTPRPAAPPPSSGPRQQRSAAYHVSLTVAVMLTLGLVAALVVLSLDPPQSRVAGNATGLPIPDLPSPTESVPATTQPPSSNAPEGPLGELATHPLSASTATMSPLTCALPRFDPADAAQERFYDAAKVCADGAFGGLLTAAGLPAVPVNVVTVHGGPSASPCGEVAPTAPATQCRGTVFMTPARLRDTEGLDRFPGKYFGVFLREYAAAVQFGTGLTDLYDAAAAAPGVPGDLEERLVRQATCLAGIASAAMDGRGAVDANITGEIRTRLTSVDAPSDADAWLTKGYDSRRPASCNTWRG